MNPHKGRMSTLKKAASLAVVFISVFGFAVAHGAEKPKYLWMCGEANLVKFATRDSITYYLEKAKDAGFNNVVADVRPIEGKALYKSNIVPMLTTIDGKIFVNRTWDYLEYMIEEAHRLGMKVTASACVFPAASPWWRRGLVYDDPMFDGKTCIEYHADGTRNDIRDNSKKVAAFLNPARVDNRAYALAILREIVRNYDIDGLALDYCRYPDAESDFSEDSHKAFEQYLGKKVKNFPDDIFTYNADGSHKPGKYYKEWWAFRAGIISDFVGAVHDMIKAEKPSVELNYWAASWIHALYGNGQNWASPRSNWGEGMAFFSPEYMKTGFAPKLDNFIVGTYLERVYGAEDNESVEYGLNRANRIVDGDCHVIGSINSPNHSSDPADAHNLYNAVRCCLEKSEGVMVFDIVHVINRNQWKDIRRAIKDYEKEHRQ